ncbi:MAG: hypothetical protein GX593_07395 [Actinomycetales bacterium]|nr:hypothetical protein [Actinomycetales bacterium]
MTATALDQNLAVAVECPDAAPATGTPRSTWIVASGLWVFVGGLLAYGIVQTAIKAAALFG